MKIRTRLIYKCNNCGAEDFEPKCGEKDEYGMGQYVCPECGSDSIEEGYTCPICGKYSEFSFCAECKDDIQTRFSAMLHENFSELEIEAINEIFDGEEIK